MGAVVTSILLALRQIGDPAILRILGKSLAITLILFALLGWVGWTAFERTIGWAGLEDASLWGWGDELREFAALVLTLIAGWLLWRIIALAVIQFFADDVVLAVEARHYPAAAANRRDLSLREEIALGTGGAVRALLVNLIALPVAILLLVTGIGTAILFWLVNAVLLGRELQDMVWVRQRTNKADITPVSRFERVLLGSAVAGLMLVPVLNFLGPVLGAAAATHLIHRKRTP